MTDETTPCRRAVLASTAGLAVTFAGCGSGDSTSTPADGTATATDVTATPTAPPTPVPESLSRATWTTGEKHGVLTAAPPQGDSQPSRVWATLTRGALTEPRFPRVDAMQLRRVDYLITDGDRVWRTLAGPGRTDDDIERQVERVVDDALLFRHRFETADWSLTVEYAAGVTRDAVVADVQFDAPDGYALYVIGRTALSQGAVGDETSADAALSGADADSYLQGPNGEEYPTSLSIVAADGFTWTAAAPADGPVARRLIAAGEAAAEPPGAATGDAVLAGRLASGSIRTRVALGFAAGTETDAATATAEAALADGYQSVRREYVASWQRFLADIDLPASVRDAPDLAAQYRVAAMTLRAVEDVSMPGAGLASPSVPWGSAIAAGRPRDVGYNFVWSRDLYQAFTALEAMGKLEEARAATRYLLAVQQDEGGFLPQNTFVDGRTRWGGEQMDNIAFPLVMAHQLRERHGIWEEAGYGYADIRASAEYIARGGPGTGQERWEEEGGLSPSTIAAEIAGLACAAREADREGNADDAVVWLALADAWRAGVQTWCVTQEGADGHEPPYYFRINADRDPDDGTTRGLANGGPTLDERAIIDAGFLELVRLGILPADDPVIEQSVAVVDDALRVDTPNGPGWYRYTGDGYGEGVGPDAAEQYNASPADFGEPWPLAANGKGRLWPIFTGERGEFELRRAESTDPATTPETLLATMARFANAGGMIPEQVWDRPEPSPYGWRFGEGTASATPLSWSMAQFIRLAHGIDAGRPVETPAFVADRYVDGLPPEPALSVTFPDTTVEERPVRITGDTDADEVVVRSSTESQRVTVGDGRFEAEVDLDDGRNTLTVVAVATAAELTETGLAVDRTVVSYVGE